MLMTSPSLQSLYQRSERKRGEKGYYSTQQTEWVLSSHAQAPTIPNSLDKHLARSLKWQSPKTRTDSGQLLDSVYVGGRKHGISPMHGSFVQRPSRTLRGGSLEGYHSRRTPLVSPGQNGMAERGRPLAQSLPAHRFGGSHSYRTTGQSLSGWVGVTTGAFADIRIGGLHNYLSSPKEFWTPISMPK